MLKKIIKIIQIEDVLVVVSLKFVFIAGFTKIFANICEFLNLSDIKPIMSITSRE